MSEVYTVTVNGNEITYGAYTQRSRFSEEEWSALCHEMVKQNFERDYRGMTENEVIAWGNFIDMSERYEALLEELPQNHFSKAGTHPVWVADEVNESTYDRDAVQSDMLDLVEGYKFNDPTNGEAILEDLIEYFGLESYKKNYSKIYHKTGGQVNVN